MWTLKDMNNLKNQYEKLEQCTDDFFNKQAEGIMAQLRIPTSVVINMLYKQIAMTKSIPFSLKVSNEFQTLDEMSEEEFNLMMQKQKNPAL